MLFDFTALGAKARYKLLSATVTPRPIAWVSSFDDRGVLNAAPFSYFNVFSEDPPLLAISISRNADGEHKDTLRNILAQGEFAVNLVGEANLDPMNVSAIDFAPDVSEFQQAGLRPEISTAIRTPRIAESPVAFECTLFRTIELGPARSLVLGEVKVMHIMAEAVLDARRCMIDTAALGLIGRGGAGAYVRTRDVVRRPALTLADWWPAQSLESQNKT